MTTTLQSALRELIIERNAPEKLSFDKLAGPGKSLKLFEMLGRLADKPIQSGVNALWRGGKTLAKDPRAAIDPMLYHGLVQPGRFARAALGGNTLNEEGNLASAVGARPQLSAAYKKVNDFLTARGVKSPLTAGAMLTSPFSTISARATDAGRMRWIAEHLSNPANRAQALHMAPPDVSAAADRFMNAKIPQNGLSLNPAGRMVSGAGPQLSVGDHVAKGTHVPFAAHALPYGLAALGVAHHLDEGQPEDRPFVSSMGPGLFGEDHDANGYESFMNSMGNRLSPYSPAIGAAMRNHPYAAGAAGAAGLGAGAIGLRHLFGGGDNGP